MSKRTIGYLGKTPIQVDEGPASATVDAGSVEARFGASQATPSGTLDTAHAAGAGPIHRRQITADEQAARLKPVEPSYLRQKVSLPAAAQERLAEIRAQGTDIRATQAILDAIDRDAANNLAALDVLADRMHGTSVMLTGMGRRLRDASYVLRDETAPTQEEMMVAALRSAGTVPAPRLSRRPDSRPGRDGMTDRQRQAVDAFVKRGGSYTLAAIDLNLSNRAVRSHLEVVANAGRLTPEARALYDAHRRQS